LAVYSCSPSLTPTAPQHAYSTGLLSVAQFGELEELQTEHPTFIEEGALRRRRCLWLLAARSGTVRHWPDEALLARSGAESRAAVVQTFAEEAEVMLRELAEHCARGSTHSPPEFQPARDVLHKLNGSALTLGAAGVSDCCTSVRKLLVAGSLAELHSSAETPGSLASLRHSVESVKGACSAAWRPRGRPMYLCFSRDSSPVLTARLIALDSCSPHAHAHGTAGVLFEYLRIHNLLLSLEW